SIAAFRGAGTLLATNCSGDDAARPHTGDQAAFAVSGEQPGADASRPTGCHRVHRAAPGPGSVRLGPAAGTVARALAAAAGAHGRFHGDAVEYVRAAGTVVVVRVAVGPRPRSLATTSWDRLPACLLP